MNNYAAIPAELRAYRQWIVWRYEETQNGKPTKLPYNPITGGLASVDDPTTWTDFDTAVAVAGNGNFSGLGFVLTEHDPFCFVDLDATPDTATRERQIKIYEAFDTYSEHSPSGQGAHLICKAHVARGRKRTSVEIYSSLRYMTMTGRVINPKPIAERHEMANILWSEMGKDIAGNPVVMDGPQTADDAEVLRRAYAVPTGLKFAALYEGRWQEVFPEIAAAGQGPSEADFALVDLIQNQTKNRDQIRRIFMSSALGQRDKVTKRPDYVNRMIDRSFDREMPPQDFEMFRITAQNIKAANGSWSTQPQTTTAAHPGVTREAAVAGSVNREEVASDPRLTKANTEVNPYSLPPGLIGEIADYIYRSAPRPVPEIALAGAIGLMSGIAGRTYQTPTGVALNLYTLLIAKSGRGKEAMAQGIWRIMHAASHISPKKPGAAVPAITDFVGPTDFRSDAALTKELSSNPCFVSIMGEFGLRMQAMVAPNASSHLLGLRSVMLDLYHKADRSSQLSAMVYSDKDKNTKAVYRPSFSILAETTPATYYEALSEALIMQGLLSRFLTIEYPGPRPDQNEHNVEPSLELIQSVGNLATQCLTMMNQTKIVPVVFNPQAHEAQREYNRQVDKHINSSQTDAFAELWNRAHIKTLKLASLYAVGVNPHHPLVDIAAWEWAQRIVDHDVQNTVDKFESGEVGKMTGNDDQNRDFTDIVIDWFTKDWSQLSAYCNVSEGDRMHADGVIPHSYLSVRTAKFGSFRNDKSGARTALYATLRNFTQEGLITATKANQLKDIATGAPKYGGHGDVYIIKDDKLFRERAHGRKRSF